MRQLIAFFLSKVPNVQPEQTKGTCKIWGKHPMGSPSELIYDDKRENAERKDIPHQSNLSHVYPLLNRMVAGLQFSIFLTILTASLFLASAGYSTVTSTANTITYSGNGATVNFTYTFPLLDDDDMQVWITDSAGNQTLLTSNYEVDTDNSRVIYPTTGSALASGSTITLLRVVPLTQSVDLTNTGPLPAETLEQAYDKLTMGLQQMQERLGRTLQYPVGSVASSTDTASLLTLIEASSGNVIAAAASAAEAASYAAALSTPIPVSNGGTGSNTTLSGGYFMQSSGTQIIESAVSVATFAGFLPGMSVDYRGTSAPSGWLLEDGTSYSTSTYSALFAAIGYTYGGSGAYFNVPDSRGRVNVGAGTGTGLTARTVGQSFGTETHALAVSEMPTHAHGVTDPGHRHLFYTASGSYVGKVSDWNGNSTDSSGNANYTRSNSTGISIQSAGSGTAHNNMQPSLVTLRIIKT